MVRPGFDRPPSLLGAPRRMKFREARTTGGAALLDSTNGEPGWSTEAEENGRRRGAETMVGNASPVASGGTRRRTNGDALYGGLTAELGGVDLGANGDGEP
jgi:hypothetical protein